jgi:hypothetical protein
MNKKQRRLTIFALIAFVVIGLCHKISFGIWDKGQRGAQPENTSLDLRTLAKRARNAVVSIEVFDDQECSIGTGSGFFVSNDGFSLPITTL